MPVLEFEAIPWVYASCQPQGGCGVVFVGVCVCCTVVGTRGQYIGQRVTEVLCVAPRGLLQAS